MTGVPSDADLAIYSLKENISCASCEPLFPEKNIACFVKCVCVCVCFFVLFVSLCFLLFLNGANNFRKKINLIAQHIS
jgi:hypothetical protein